MNNYYGFNIKSEGAHYFPTTSDLALTLVYKLNDNKRISVDASYKLGWGNGWKEPNGLTKFTLSLS